MDDQREHDEREDYDDEPWRKRSDGDVPVQWIASSISTFGLLQLLCSAAGLLGGTVSVFVLLLDPESAGPGESVRIILVFLIYLLGVGSNALVMRGARDMRRYRRYRLAVLAAALSILPVPLVFFGPCSVPLGISALVVLLRPDVRARFAAVARGTINESGSPPN